MKKIIFILAALISIATFNSNLYALQNAPISTIYSEKSVEGVKISWVVESLGDNKYFIIERSADGVNFEEIGSMRAKKAKACSKLHFVDTDPSAGANYYRVKQIDFDKGHKYSTVITFTY